MKNIFKFLLVLVASSLSIISCSKEEIEYETNSPLPKLDSFYSAVCCTLPDGAAGAECIIASSETCFSPISCTLPGNGQVSNFTQVLHANYSNAQIQSMMGRPITDIALLHALKQDGFPIR